MEESKLNKRVRYYSSDEINSNCMTWVLGVADSLRMIKAHHLEVSCAILLRHLGIIHCQLFTRKAPYQLG